MAAGPPAPFEFDAAAIGAERRCFLCGTELNRENKTFEHIVPQWLLRSLGLWNETLTLLNGTSIPYRQLRLPCCKTCNGTHLGPLEERVALAYRDGAEGFRRLDRTTLFLWLSKVYYGLMLRETSLASDRSLPQSPPILSAEGMERFHTHHLLLQAARGAVAILEDPASILIFDAQVSRDPRLNFDYGDNFATQFLALRFGPVAILAALQDGGAMERSLRSSKLDHARALKLHPMQFSELMAFGIAASWSLQRSPKYLLIGDNDRWSFITIPGGGPRYGPFQEEVYLRLLGKLMAPWGITEVTRDGQPLSWLIDPDQKPIHLPVD